MNIFLKRSRAMSGRAKEKVVTSGRLTGQADRQSPDPGPTVRPELVYSLYSSDSEDQVSSLHRGLDQCAALLGGILQAEKAVSAGHPRTPGSGKTQSRPSTSQEKWSAKRLSAKTGSTRAVKSRGTRSKPSNTQGRMAVGKPQTDLRRSEPSRRCSSAPATQKPPAPRTPAVVSEAKQRSPDKQALLLSSHALQKTRPQTPPERDGEDQVIPVRDTGVLVSHGTTRTMMMDPGQDEKVPKDGRRTEPENVQDLLKELRALIAGQGSVAERLLSRLEQTVSSNHQTEPEPSSLPSCRCMKQEPQKQEILSTSEVVLQEELTTAQSRLHQLQDRWTELQNVLQDTQSRLRDTEAEKKVLQTDLEVTKRRLQQSERLQNELSSLAQQRLQEIETLQRLLQSQNSSDYCVQRLSKPPSSKEPAAPPTDRIKQYLMSLNHMDPPQRDGDSNTPVLADISPHRQHRDVSSAPQHKPNLSCSGDVQPSRQHLLNTSRYDMDSVCSDWSLRSGSTFDTRDETAFKDGLAALDASIASLQRTIQLDLKN